MPSSGRAGMFHVGGLGSQSLAGVARDIGNCAVSNALITRQKLEEVRAQQARAVSALEDSVKISLQRYVADLSSYYEVLEAQQQLFPAENALAQTQLNQLVVIVSLYKALSGGWNLPDDKWAGP